MSKYRTCFTLHLLASPCFSCRYWTKASMYVSTVEIVHTYRLSTWYMFFLFIDIVPNSILVRCPSNTINTIMYEVALERRRWGLSIDRRIISRSLHWPSCQRIDEKSASKFVWGVRYLACYQVPGTPYTVHCYNSRPQDKGEYVLILWWILSYPTVRYTYRNMKYGISISCTST